MGETLDEGACIDCGPTMVEIDACGESVWILEAWRWTTHHPSCEDIARREWPPRVSCKNMMVLRS